MYKKCLCYNNPNGEEIRSGGGVVKFHMPRLNNLGSKLYFGEGEGNGWGMLEVEGERRGGEELTEGNRTLDAKPYCALNC